MRRALLAEKSITYSDPANGGASGIHFAKVLERLGIVKEIEPKTIFAKPGDEIAVLVAKGKAEIGVHAQAKSPPTLGGCQDPRIAADRLGQL